MNNDTQYTKEAIIRLLDKANDEQVELVWTFLHAMVTRKN